MALAASTARKAVWISPAACSMAMPVTPFTASAAAIAAGLFRVWSATRLEIVRGALS